jgi:hypothetical protein
MKITLSSKLRQAASALLVVMVLGGILCLFVMYYLALVEQQNTLGVRSQAWNVAIAISEAGIEDGLQALNSKSFDGWNRDGTTFWRANTLPDGNSYVVTNNLANTNRPVITARAYIQLPALAANTPETFFATVGSANRGATIVTRAVQVTCRKNPTSLFTAAMVSKHAIDLNGNGVSSDSFDSSNPAKSTNGRYDPYKYQGDFGDVATNDGIIVGVGNANIYGKLHTGPEGGYDLGPQGGVGTHAWQAANGGGLQPDYFLQDANFTFPDTSLPDATGYLTPQPGDVQVTLHPITSNSTTSSSCPIPPPWGGITTNLNPPNTTVSTYPTPPPPGLWTNTLWVNDSSTLPNPVPAGSTTNTTHHASLFRPNPEPPNLVINTESTKSKFYPLPGTYVPPVTYDGKNWYYYNRITGFEWDTYTYNYPTYTYTYPTPSYTYFLYQTNTLVVTNHYDNVLYANRKYVSTALNGSSIVLGPNVTLVLPNGLSGAEHLFFDYENNPSFSSPGLTIYAGGTSASISGNQYINPSGFAGSLIVYCAPSVTSFTLNGNGQFTGVLVAPNADLALHGGGNSEQDFCGSLMVNNARLNGHFHFHWDEALGRMESDNDARYLVKSWNEIP